MDGGPPEPLNGRGFQPHHTPWIAIGVALLALGWQTLTALYQAQVTAPTLWQSPVFDLATLGAAIATIIGIYVLLAVFTGWWLPEPRKETQKYWKVGAYAFALIVVIIAVAIGIKVLRGRFTTPGPTSTPTAPAPASLPSPTASPFASPSESASTRKPSPTPTAPLLVRTEKPVQKKRRVAGHPKPRSTPTATPSPMPTPTPAFEAEIYNNWVGYYPFAARAPYLFGQYDPPLAGESTVVFVFVKVHNLNDIAGATDLWTMHIALHGRDFEARAIHPEGRFTINAPEYNKPAGEAYDEESEAIYNTASPSKMLTQADQWVTGFFIGEFNQPSEKVLSNLETLEMQFVSNGEVHHTRPGSGKRSPAHLQYLVRADMSSRITPLPPP